VTPSNRAYLNEAGHPILRDSVVAFIDILGFSYLVTSTPSPDAQRVLDLIVAAVQDSRRFVRDAFEQEAPGRSRDWVLKFFSDNLALGYPLDQPEHDLPGAVAFVIRAAQRYQLGMALNGFFLRGALTLGPICLTDEIIFGSSLIECYQLETKASIVPRVILAEPLWKRISSLDRMDDLLRDSICRDVDGWWFINYLQSARTESEINWDYVERHKRSILDSLSRTTRHDVLPKFGWACRYHNVFCHWHRDEPGYSDRFRIDRVDEHSTMNRLGDLDATNPRTT